MNSIRKSIYCISVVEWLCTKDFEKKSIANKGRAIIYILVWLNNPNKLFNWVVEVEFNLVT